MEIMEKVKIKASELKDKAEDIWYEKGGLIIGGGAIALVGIWAIYLKAYFAGINYGRKEWDFANDKGQWAVLMEEDGEFRTALPISVIKEVMDKHHTKAWDNSMWRKLDR